MTSNRMRRLLPRAARTTALAALMLTVVSGCSLLDMLDPPQDAEIGVGADAQPKTVQAEPAQLRLIEEPIAVTADVVSSVQVELAPVVGGTVEKLYKKIGDAVKEGEPIAKLSSEEAQFAYDQAVAEVEQAKAGIQSAKRELSVGRQEMAAEIRKMELELNELVRNHNKTKNDYDSGLASKSELDRSSAGVQAYKAELQLAKRRLQSLDNAEAMASLEKRLADAELALKRSGEALTQLEIKAPVDGIITGLRLIEGLSVASREPVGRIERVDPVRIVAQLSEEAAKLAAGKQSLRFALPTQTEEEPREPREARVNYLAGIADPEKRTYTLELEAPNADGGLKPGMKVSVELSDDAALTAVAVPLYSVLEEGGRRYVYVLENGVAKRREVELGRVSPAYYEVLSGVREGELVVVSGMNGLEDGERVLAHNVATEGNG